MVNNFPRRHSLYRMTKEEIAIFNLIQEIEAMGCHAILTDVVVLLGQAKDRLSDFVDLQLAYPKPEGEVND